MKAEITKLPNLTTNGFLKTSGGDGTLSADTATYAPTASPAFTGTPTGIVALKNDTTEVSTSAAAAPSAGQVLTATANNTATWQTPSVIPLTITVSSAEIQALNGTPKTLVVAPGAGFMNQLTSIQFSLDYNSVAYVIGTTNNMVVKYKDGTGPSATTMFLTTGFFDQTVDKIGLMQLVDVFTSGDATSFANQPLVLTIGFAGNLTSGNSPLYVHLTYVTIPTGL